MKQNKGVKVSSRGDGGHGGVEGTPGCHEVPAGGGIGKAVVRQKALL